MAFLNKQSSLKKGQQEDVGFDKNAFLFATSISDDHFKNELNWEKVCLVYMSPDKKQKQIVLLKDDFSRGFYQASERSKSGKWTLEEIRISDFDGEIYVLKRPSIPSVESCDMAIERVIAPAAKITKTIFEPNLNLVKDGDFSNGSLDQWINLSSTGVASSVNGELRFTKEDGQVAKVYQTIDTVPGKIYNVSYDVTRDDVTGIYPQPVCYIKNDSNGTIIAEKTVDNGIATYTLSFTAQESKTRIQVGVNGETGAVGTMCFDNISVLLASPKMISIQLEEGVSEHYLVGFKIKLWNSTLGSYVSSEVYSIIEKNGEIYTLDKALPEGLNISTNIILAKFPDYSTVSGIQRMKYTYVGITE